MAKITKAHMLECYNAFKHGKDCPYPEEMNPTSAQMTMSWLKNIWNDRRWDLSFSCMQAEVVLAQITIDDGENKARQVAQSIERDINLRHQNPKTPMKKHREAIEPFLKSNDIHRCNAPKIKPQPIITKTCERCHKKLSLSEFAYVNSKICDGCQLKIRQRDLLNNPKTKTKPDLRRICECCRTEQPLSEFSDNAGFSSFKTCQRCRDVARSARNQRNKPRRSCY